MKSFKVTIAVRDDVNPQQICMEIEHRCNVMGISEPEMLEPEWKKEVRKIFARISGTTIDENGVVHGRLYTNQIKDILKAGGLLMVHYDGEVVISNWKHQYREGGG